MKNYNDLLNKKMTIGELVEKIEYTLEINPISLDYFEKGFTRILFTKRIDDTKHINFFANVTDNYEEYKEKLDYKVYDEDEKKKKLNSINIEIEKIEYFEK